MPIILLVAVGFFALFWAGAGQIAGGLRSAGVLPQAQERDRVQARQFAMFARAALNEYTDGGGTPPSPCYNAQTLDFAPGFTEPAGWGCFTSQYNNQTLFWVYGTLKAPTLSYLLSEVHGQTFGVNSNGTLSLPGGGNSPVPVPGQIPNGDVVSLTATENAPFDWQSLNGESASGSFVFSGSPYSVAVSYNGQTGCTFCCTVYSGQSTAYWSASVTNGVPAVNESIVNTWSECFWACSYYSSTTSASGDFSAGTISSGPPPYGSDSVSLDSYALPSGLVGFGTNSNTGPQTSTAPWS